MPEEPNEQTETALEGLKVLEYGDFISAAYATKLLADLGADVIKVELPDRGDSSRRHGPFPNDEPHPEKSSLYLFLNTNKRSITLDPAKPSGQRLFRELGQWADIVIHNLPPQHLEEHGLTYELLSESNPGLVMVSITVFGYDTPYRDWKGYALNATAGSGLSYRIGNPKRAPLWIPYCAADFQGGIHGSMTALLGLRARDLTGEGQHAWLSIIEVMGVIMGGSALPQYVFRGQVRGRNGTRMDMYYPWEVAPVKDGYVEVTASVDAHWQRFVELMGNERLKNDERLQNRYLAFQWAEELDEHWHPWMKEHTRAELFEMSRDNRLPFHPINTIEEAVNSEHLKARDFWVEVEHPVMGRYTTLGAPYKLSESPWSIRRPPPLLGQHNQEIYHQMLGYSQEDLVRLRQAGII